MDELAFARGLGCGVLGSNTGIRETLQAEQVAAVLAGEGGLLRFENVAVAGTLNLRALHLRRPVCFTDCELPDIESDSAQFDGLLWFKRCTIGRWRGRQSHFGRELRITRGSVTELILPGAVFDEACSIVGATITRVDLSWCRASGNLRLRRLAGADSVTLRQAVIERDCDLRRVHATNVVLRGVSSRSLRAALLVAGDVNLDYAAVKNEIDLSGARIAGSLFVFGAGAAALILDRCTVARDASVRNGTFGSLSARHATVTGQLRISDSAFSAVSMAAVRVEMEFTFGRNTVTGSAAIEADGAKRSSFGRSASLSGSSIGSQLILDGVVVRHTLAFTSVSAGDVILRRTKARLVTGVGAVARQQMVVDHLRAAQDVDLHSLTAPVVEFRWFRAATLRLSYANIHEAYFDHARVAELRGIHTEVTGTLAFEHTKIGRSLVLDRSRLGGLAFEDQLVDGAGTFVFPTVTSLTDCQYATLRASWRDVLASLRGSAHYDASAYRILEAYIRGLGRVDWADEIYLTGRRHATTTLSAAKRGSQWVLDWTSGYGAQPVKLLRAAALVFAVMALVFAVYTVENPKALGKGAGGSALLARWLGLALDVLVQGDKSKAIAPFQEASTQVAIRLLIDAIGVLRYATLALLGLWIAYITGLVRYAAGGKA